MYNPYYRKRRSQKKIKKLSYTDRCILAGKEIITDKKNGYTVPIEFYNTKYHLY